MKSPCSRVFVLALISRWLKVYVDRLIWAVIWSDFGKCLEIQRHTSGQWWGWLPHKNQSSVWSLTHCQAHQWIYSVNCTPRHNGEVPNQALQPPAHVGVLQHSKATSCHGHTPEWIASGKKISLDCQGLLEKSQLESVRLIVAGQPMFQIAIMRLWIFGEMLSWNKPCAHFKVYSSDHERLASPICLFGRQSYNSQQPRPQWEPKQWGQWEIRIIRSLVQTAAWPFTALQQMDLSPITESYYLFELLFSLGSPIQTYPTHPKATY